MLIEIVYWIAIFLSPNFMTALSIAILYSINGRFSYWYLCLFIPAIIIGVIIAERARKKHGTSNYYAKTMSTPDLAETREDQENL